MSETENFELYNYTDYEMVTKDAEGEAHIHHLRANRYRRDNIHLESLLVRQAPPIHIKPSRAKMPERDFQRIIDLPDLQMDYRRLLSGEYQPIHDEPAMKVARMICQDLKPDTIVVGGDNVDMAALARFEKDSSHFSGPEALQMAIDGLSTFLGHLRAENPQSRIIMLEGNHDRRLAKYVLKQAEKLYGLKRANSQHEYPVNTLPFLLRLKDMNVEYVSGYPANEFHYSDHLMFVHGQKTRSNGSTAELYSREYDKNVVHHHIHRHEMHSRTLKNGRFITAASFGTLASIKGLVPSYGNGVDDMGNPVELYENWQNGVGIIDDYGDGELQFTPVRIYDGRARIAGREYVAD